MTGPAGGQTTHKAHRWIYAQLIGPVDGVVVRHTCDVPACVNVQHLVLGTQLDNVHDAIERGRRPSVGLATVQRIREAFSLGVTVAELARRERIPYHTVYGITSRANWRHVA
ncbi:MAG: HNH endonuclease [Tepidisphaeraceae bacterium]